MPGLKTPQGKYDDPKKAEATRDVVQYCLTEGQKISDEMGNIPLPENVAAAVGEAAQNAGFFAA